MILVRRQYLELQVVVVHKIMLGGGSEVAELGGIGHKTSGIGQPRRLTPAEAGTYELRGSCSQSQYCREGAEPSLETFKSHFDPPTFPDALESRRSW